MLIILWIYLQIIIVLVHVNYYLTHLTLFPIIYRIFLITRHSLLNTIFIPLRKILLFKY